MAYLQLFITVFLVIGGRAFQQKVVAANNYPGMGIVGAMIWMGEGIAVLKVVSGGTLLHVASGACGAGLGVMTFVFIYNRLFNKKGIASGQHQNLGSASGPHEATEGRAESRP